MIKASIQIDDLRKIDERKVELPPNMNSFSITMSYLINDFANKNNMIVEDVLKDINNVLAIIQRYN